jgi:hypothetical protein
MEDGRRRFVMHARVGATGEPAPERAFIGEDSSRALVQAASETTSIGPARIEGDHECRRSEQRICFQADPQKNCASSLSSG